MELEKKVEEREYRIEDVSARLMDMGNALVQEGFETEVQAHPFYMKIRRKGKSDVIFFENLHNHRGKLDFARRYFIAYYLAWISSVLLPEEWSAKDLKKLSVLSRLLCVGEHQEFELTEEERFSMKLVDGAGDSLNLAEKAYRLGTRGVYNDQITKLKDLITYTSSFRDSIKLISQKITTILPDRYSVGNWIGKLLGNEIPEGDEAKLTINQIDASLSEHFLSFTDPTTRGPKEEFEGFDWAAYEQDRDQRSQMLTAKEFMYSR